MISARYQQGDNPKDRQKHFNNRPTFADDVMVQTKALQLDFNKTKS
jgi:hypothetical protein